MRKPRNRVKKKKFAPHEPLEAKKNDGRNQHVWEGSEQDDDSRKARQGRDHEVKNTDDKQTFQIPPLPGITLLQKQTKSFQDVCLFSQTQECCIWQLSVCIFSLSLVLMLHLHASGNSREHT